MKTRPLAWYVVAKHEAGRLKHHVVAVRVLGGLERLMNGMAKFAFEIQARQGKKRIKGKFTEVGGPFATQERARQCKYVLAGRRPRKVR